MTRAPTGAALVGGADGAVDHSSVVGKPAEVEQALLNAVALPPAAMVTLPVITGAIVSTVQDTSEEAENVPPGSAARTANLCAPSARFE
jgi:hypothetical protein